jgi:hypothetical protein
MALQLGALRDALLEAGASKDKAEKAAEELAGYDSQIAHILSDLRLLKWEMRLIGLVLVAIGIPSLWLLVRVAAKVGALPI